MYIHGYISIGFNEATNLIVTVVLSMPSVASIYLVIYIYVCVCVCVSVDILISIYGVVYLNKNTFTLIQ